MPLDGFRDRGGSLRSSLLRRRRGRRRGRLRLMAGDHEKTREHEQFPHSSKAMNFFLFREPDHAYIL